jgi:hypothetical protein
MKIKVGTFNAETCSGGKAEGTEASDHCAIFMELVI